MISSSESSPSTILSYPFSEQAPDTFKIYVSLSITMILNSLLLVSFYDTTWAPADDGTYAHIGERILSGEISNKDFQSMHPGLINFATAASMWMFGPQLVSLRFPLILLGLLQGIMVHVLFSRLWPWLGIIASVSLTSLGILQYMNPAAHWYCHVLFIALIGVLHWTRPFSMGRMLLLGFLIGTIFLSRQLTGVIGGIGLLTYLLMESSTSKDVSSQDLLFSRLLLSLMGVGLLFYFMSYASLIDFLLFGLCPIAFIGLVLFFTTCNNGDAFRIVWQLSLGAFFSLLPLLVYHLMNNSIAPWMFDMIFRAIHLSQLPVFFQREYGQLVGISLSTLLNVSGVNSLINGSYLLLLSMMSFLNGGLLLWTFLKKRQEGSPKFIPSALPLLAMFYAVVSIVYPTLIYLYLTVGLSLLGVLWQTYANRARVFGLMLAGFLSIVAIHFHAGQPRGQSWAKFMEGENVAIASVPELEKFGLEIGLVEGETYSQLVSFIKQKTNQTDPIFVFPNNPEIYFLTDRPNPFPFYYFPSGVPNEKEGHVFIQSLEKAPPTLIIFNSGDINNTDVSVQIAEYVREAYLPIKQIGEFEIFSLPEQ